MTPAIKLIETKMASGQTPTIEELYEALTDALASFKAMTAALQNVALDLTTILAPRIAGDAAKTLEAVDALIAKSVVMKSSKSMH